MLAREEGNDTEIDHLRTPRTESEIAARNLLGRLERVLDEESAALRENGPLDVSQFTRRKNQILLELVQASGELSKARIERIKSEATIIRGKLRSNSNLLLTHLNAAREITSLISRRILEADSDGTYQRPNGRREIAP